MHFLQGNKKFVQRENASQKYTLLISVVLCTEKQEARGKLTRMDTSTKFDNASEALRRYESRNPPSLNEADEITSDNEADEG